MISSHLELLRTFRRFELEAALPFLPAQGVLCELGGGDGFQASLLSEAGYQVRSFDTSPASADQRVHDVEAYDGMHIPLPDESVDGVFSSSVMEHVDDLDSLLSEQWRILKTEGVAVHVIPNQLWRCVTSITHYPWLLKRALFRQPAFSHAGTRSDEPRSPAWYLSRILAAPPHGNGNSALAELFTFAPAWWKKRLVRPGLEMERCIGTGLFYSGNALLPRIPFSWRQWIGSNVGSVCTIYVLRKTGSAPG